jgi:hypothetical protein
MCWRVCSQKSIHCQFFSLSNSFRKTMKVSALIFTLIHLCAISSADRMIRVLFNNGKEPSSNQTCTKDDNLLIDRIFNTTSTRRNLRSINHANKIRQLWPVYCKNNCRGYQPLTCRATNCIGYRRELATNSSLINTINNITCSAQIQLINATLNTLVATNAVTSGCRGLLKKARNFSCYDDVIYGEIEYIRVQTLKNETLIEVNDDEDEKEILSICKSIPFRIEVSVNTCVDNLESRYAGPLGNYTIPSDKFPFLFVFHSFWLWFPGNYTMQYIPDGIESKSKTLQLELKKC